MVNIAKKTTISLFESTKKQLADFQIQKGETFDDILQRIITNFDSGCQNKSKDDVVAETGEEK